MAYISQADKNELMPNIKEVLLKHNVKGTVSVRNYSTLVVSIREGALDFFNRNHRTPGLIFTGQDISQNYESVNQYHYQKHYKDQPECVAFFDGLFKAMKGTKWYDKSDIMYDHFDTAYYLSVHVGKWDRPYIHAPIKNKSKTKVSYLMEGMSKTIELTEQEWIEGGFKMTA